MSKLNPTFVRALDAGADPVSGGECYVYTAGTTTPVTTYSDSALTIAQAHPIIANSAGEFPDIYVAAGAYKVVVKDASSVTLYETDNVTTVSVTSISDTQWGYLAALDQGLATTDNPTFASPVVSYKSGTAVTPAAQDTFVGQHSTLAADYAGMILPSGTSGFPYYLMGPAATPYDGGVVYDVANEEIELKAGGNVIVRAGAGYFAPQQDMGADLGTLAAPEGNRIWKDLYLSGGIYLGGTVAANFFDDYEEGTFTPAAVDESGNTATTYTSRKGTYTKWGRLVFVEGQMIDINTTPLTGADNLGIGALPFTVKSGSGAVNGGLSITAITHNQGTFPNPRAGTTYAWLLEQTGTAFTFVDVSDVTSGSGDIDFSFCYLTDA